MMNTGTLIARDAADFDSLHSLAGQSPAKARFSDAMAYGIPRRNMDSADRRASNRLPIERDVRYKVLGKPNRESVTGLGKTFNMSGRGVLFTTESRLAVGQQIELTVSWPARLNDVVPLKLVALGRVVRAEERQAAMAIGKYEFRTCRSGGVGRDELSARCLQAAGKLEP